MTLPVENRHYQRDVRDKSKCMPSIGAAAAVLVAQHAYLNPKESFGCSIRVFFWQQIQCLHFVRRLFQPRFSASCSLVPSVCFHKGLQIFIPSFSSILIVKLPGNTCAFLSKPMIASHIN